MEKQYLWQYPDFPHFYHSPAVVEPLEVVFRKEMSKLAQFEKKSDQGFSAVITEEVIANSALEGILLDRESVHSSFLSNLTPAREKEQGAVTLTRMALTHFDEPLSHDLLFSMHRILMAGADFPEASVGAYVGDMKVVSGNRLDRELSVVHEGVKKEDVHEAMSEFIRWYNQCPPEAPLVNAVQGHIHFETIHPFCDGNGRIGRSLILMGLCRDLQGNTPLALSRVFNANAKDYYIQFRSELDLTTNIRSMAPLFIKAIKETERILALTAFRTRVSDRTDSLNPRQMKVLHRLVDYELRDGFQGGMNNAKYQKMTGIGDRTALRDLQDLHQRGFMVKTGERKGTRYHLNVVMMEDDVVFDRAVEVVPDGSMK